MHWHHREGGFKSDDTNDEQTIFDRAERKYYRELEERHGKGSIFLKKRKVMPFERLILEKMGGLRIFEELLSKDLPSRIPAGALVYDYQNTAKKIDHEYIFFLRG